MTSQPGRFNRPAEREGIPPTLEEWQQETGYDPERGYDDRPTVHSVRPHYRTDDSGEDVDGGTPKLHVPRDARFDRQEPSWTDDALDLNIDHYHGGYGEGMEVRCFDCMTNTADESDLRCTPCRFKWKRRVRGAARALDDQHSPSSICGCDGR